MKAGAKLLIPFGIFLTAGALFAQKINAQAVDKVLRSNSSIARQLPLSENAISSVKIVETKNSQEVWVDGRMGRVKLTTFPKGANVEFAMLSASGSGAMLNKVADSEPQIVGIKLKEAIACFAENTFIDVQVNGVDNWTDSFGGPMHKPIAENAVIVFTQGGWGNGSDSAKVYPCNFSAFPPIYASDAATLKVETFYLYNVTTDPVVALCRAVMKKHNDQFNNYMVFMKNVKAGVNKFLAVAYTYHDSSGNYAASPPVPNYMCLLGLPDSLIQNASQHAQELALDGGPPIYVFYWNDANNSKYLSKGLSIGCLDPLTAAIGNVITHVAQIEPPGISTQFSLSQNYPNPFNPSTRIEFTVPKTSFVTLGVYDASGRFVDGLMAQEMSPGKYQATFDASKLASGVYFYTLRAGNYSETKKMILVK